MQKRYGLLNSHVIPYSDPLLESRLKEIEKKISEDPNYLKEHSLDKLLYDLNQPVPWYKNLYNALRYRLPYRIKCAWDNIFVRWERGKNGYAESDVWNFYNYLSEIIAAGTEELAETTHGYPPELESLEEWQIVLRMISKGFGVLNKKEESGEALTEEEQIQFDEAMRLFGQYFVYLWD